jgi:peroxiredoxin
LGLLVALLAAPPLPAQKLPRPDPSPGRRVGDLAHDFTLKDLDGRSYRLKDLRGRRVVHVVFWATWCVPCVAEIPILRDVYAECRDRGLEILSVVISTNQTPDMVRALSRHFKINYPILFDGDDVVRGRYRVEAIPQNYLIGKDGIIRYAGTHLPADYRGLVETLLTEKPPAPAGGQAASH